MQIFCLTFSVPFYTQPIKSCHIFTYIIKPPIKSCHIYTYLIKSYHYDFFILPTKDFFFFFKKKNPNTSLPPPSTFTPPNLADIGYRERQRLCLSQIQISVFLVNLLRILILELLVLNVLDCSWIPNLLGFFGG